MFPLLCFVGDVFRFGYLELSCSVLLAKGRPLPGVISPNELFLTTSLQNYKTDVEVSVKKRASR